VTDRHPCILYSPELEYSYITFKGAEIMRVFLKIIVAPLVLILIITKGLLRFIFGYAAVVLSIASGIVGLLGVVMVIMGQTANGIILLVLAFLLSPAGIPAVISWVLDKLDDLNYSLKDFITS